MRRDVFQIAARWQPYAPAAYIQSKLILTKHAHRECTVLLILTKCLTEKGINSSDIFWTTRKNIIAVVRFCGRYLFSMK